MVAGSCLLVPKGRESKTGTSPEWRKTAKNRRSVNPAARQKLPRRQKLRGLFAPAPAAGRLALEPADEEEHGHQGQAAGGRRQVEMPADAHTLRRQAIDQPGNEHRTPHG